MKQLWKNFDKKLLKNISAKHNLKLVKLTNKQIQCDKQNKRQYNILWIYLKILIKNRYDS